MRVTPFLEGRFVAGIMGGSYMGQAAVSWIYEGGIDTGIEVYYARRFYVSAAIGWAHPVYGGVDVAALNAEPRRSCARTSRPTRSPSRWGSGCEPGGVPPSPRRLREARARGEVAHAPTLTAAAALAGGALALGLTARPAAARLVALARRGAGAARRPVRGGRRARCAATLLALVWPVAAAAFAAALVAGLAQTRVQLRAGARSGGGATSRSRGRRRRSRRRRRWCCVALGGGRALVAALARADGWAAAASVTATALGSLAARAIVVVALAGSASSRGGGRTSSEALSMSRAEAERERREDEGDPRLRAEQRRRQRALARDPLVDDVARARLVVTAEGVAVALRLVDGSVRVWPAAGDDRLRAQRHRRRGAAARHRRARRRRAGRGAGARCRRARRCRRSCRRARWWPCARVAADELRLSHDSCAQGGHPRRRPRHPLPPGDQGDPEGDAADRRRADAAAGRRGGGRRRHRGDRARHRARQGRRSRITSIIAYELEHTLRERGKNELARACASASRKMVRLVSVRQKEPLGLGHAVLVARQAVGDEPVAVLLGDDLYDCEGRRPAIGQLIDEFDAPRRRGRRSR